MQMRDRLTRTAAEFSDVMGGRCRGDQGQIDLFPPDVDRAGDGCEQVVISANREGLLSLAKQMTAMAEAPESSHLHYDENNSLEQGSTELIVERIPYNRDGGGSV